MMRRIVSEVDFSGGDDDIVSAYNAGLGEGKLLAEGVDEPYEQGSVEKLG